MSRNVNVEPEDIWGFFQENKDRLKEEMHQIAESPEFGTVVYLTEEGGFPDFVVFADNDKIYEEMAVNEHDCRITANNIYEDFLTYYVVDHLLALNKDRELTKYEMEDRIDERELELDDAVYFLLDAILEEPIDSLNFVDADEILSEVKEHILNFVTQEYGFVIRRPMFMEDEDGKEFYTEYPYECMVEDDESSTKR